LIRSFGLLQCSERHYATNAIGLADDPTTDEARVPVQQQEERRMKAYHIDRFGSVDGIVLRSTEDPRPGPK